MGSLAWLAFPLVFWWPALELQLKLSTIDRMTGPGSRQPKGEKMCRP
jgi:hypothetical protein